uniref:C4 protein n=1 Tax=Squash leaf curl Philippines virus TaxID=269277 RepID=A0A218MCJ9_9GEMI|nr:C4 protein [Squash leaf curl Philippines virus]
MGALISTFLSSSRGSSCAQITDSSTWCPQSRFQHISIRTFRELNPAPMSSPISTKVETPLNGGNSGPTVNVIRAVTNLLTTLPQRLII